LIYSPRSMICKLHSARVNSPTMPIYQDYQVCVKEEATHTRRCQSCEEATQTRGDKEIGDPCKCDKSCKGKLLCDDTHTYTCQKCKLGVNEGCNDPASPACVNDKFNKHKCTWCIIDTECNNFPESPYCNSGKCQKCDLKTHKGCSANNFNQKPKCWMHNVKGDDEGETEDIENVCVECRGLLHKEDCNTASKAKCLVDEDDPRENKCVGCIEDTDCPDETQQNIDIAYRSCKGTCGYKAFLRCEVFWFADKYYSNGKEKPEDERKPAPELKFKVFPTVNGDDDTCLKECHFHLKDSSGPVISTWNCPYIPGMVHSESYDQESMFTQLAREICFEEKTLHDDKKTLKSTMIFDKTKFDLNLDINKKIYSKKIEVKHSYKELVTRDDTHKCKP